MPIYEFRCPNGHLFERFQRMVDPNPETCEVCGEGPLQTVLHPVPVHFKGSGFYTTDYGRGSAKARNKEDGGGSSDGSSDGAKVEKKSEDKKPAEA